MVQASPYKYKTKCFDNMDLADHFNVKCVWGEKKKMKKTKKKTILKVWKNLDQKIINK